ncbi:cytochrome P450 2U1-like [Diadema setosum]|uniref:cytochrome P450 2U1-like n=1 Tax=Diadema setosum TaxID=31175 RepID=UPI003B3AE277
MALPDILSSFKENALLAAAAALAITWYGDIAFLHEGGQRLVFISSPSLVDEVLVKQANLTSGRPKLPIFKNIMDHTKGGVVFSEGDVWSDTRRFVLTALRHFGMGKQVIANETKIEATLLVQEFAAKDRLSFNPARLVNRAVCNVIARITVGRRFEDSDDKVGNVISSINTIFGSDIVLIPDAPLFLLKKERCALTHIRDFLNAEIKQHEETFDENELRDLVDMFLAEEKRRTTDSKKQTLPSKKHIWMPFFDVFVAGTDTTSMSITWAILFLAGLPSCQEKILLEIQKIEDSEGIVIGTNLQKMPYTLAFTTEVLRFRPVLPLGLPHVTTEDVSVRDYVIPRGATIMANILAIHSDPKIWGDPEVFRPERFLNADGTEFVKNKAYMPFGAGRRVCVGEQLARMEFFIFVVTLVKHLSFCIPDGIEPNYDYGHRVSTLLPKPYEIIAKPR